jgi:hypothetical protein
MINLRNFVLEALRWSCPKNYANAPINKEQEMLKESRAFFPRSIVDPHSPRPWLPPTASHHGNPHRRGSAEKSAAGHLRILGPLHSPTSCPFGNLLKLFHDSGFSDNTMVSVKMFMEFSPPTGHAI